MALTILNYGKTRTAKTSQAKHIAEYVWKKWRKKTRFVTTDVGSLWEPVQAQVDIGLIQPLFVPTDPTYNPLSLLRKLRRGDWPKNYDPSGFVLKQKGANQWLRWEEQKDNVEIGAYVFESLSSMGMGSMRDLAEKNITIGDKSVPGYRTEDGEAFGQNTESHYGMILGEVPAFMNAINTLPVELVYTTAWDEIIEPQNPRPGQPVSIIKIYKLGPMLPGRKLIDIVPGSVNVLIHAELVPVDGKSELRYYVKDRPWEVLKQYSWPAGLRLESLPSIVAAVEKKWPEGYFIPSREKGIAEVLEFRDEMREMAKAEAQKRLDALG